MQRNNRLVKQELDTEELEITEALDHAVDTHKLKSIDRLDQEIKKIREAATNYLRKNARVNFRISQNDLARLKQKAAFKGIPYQTLITSILHEYAAGHFEKLAF